MRLPGGRPVAEINVTPLVDVVLVLLIIFMVVTPLSEKQMFARVPEPDVNQVVPPDRVPPDQVVLTLRADGRVLLNREETSLEQAIAKLHDAYEGRPSRILFFNAEDAVRYDAAVKALDLAHQAGVNSIGMMTDPPPPAGR